jgi:hypothetical protein
VAGGGNTLPRRNLPRLIKERPSIHRADSCADCRGVNLVCVFIAGPPELVGSNSHIGMKLQIIIFYAER